MRRTGVFSGRTIQVVNDLSIDEQRYLYAKTRELKRALKEGSDVVGFKINSPGYGVYLIFLEASTRTKESFRNAAKFHGSKVNDFDVSTSSFTKNESMTDTVKMLAGYSEESLFVIRSKQEGVCRWLETAIGRYARKAGFNAPGFINGGDGKHEHPTQEFLDEFSFLEQMNWDESRIHIALTGDLYHGRTVHSKADGLKVFKEARVDLVAPAELAMPEHYTDKMRANGFEVNSYHSLEEYLASGKVAPIWYFTRLQLERMGDAVLEKAESLRAAVTFTKDMVKMLPEGARFFHPLPRDRTKPTNPTWLDSSPLNGWDEQSINGYYTRVVEIGMLGGAIGEDFRGEGKKREEYADDFVVEAPVVRKPKPEYKVGIKPVEDGIVIDHIGTGKPIADIWNHIDKIRKLLALNVRSSHGVYHSTTGAFKGIISLPGILSFDEKDLKKLGAIAPGCTLNLVKEHAVAKKFRMRMPPRIYNFDQISCKNESCISHPSAVEHIVPEFIRSGEGTFTCRYCEKPHRFEDIWDL